MHFECLANELILDIFQFLDATDLLRAFFNLNTRFNQLLLTKFQSYRLDLRSISKHQFRILCEQYLPSIQHRIISLHLSDDDETPNLPKLFLSYNFTLNQFIHLQSLSLSSIQSFNLLNQLIIQCSDLISFTYLNLIQCYFNYQENDLQCLMNNIWRLSKLKHCKFDQITSRKLRLTCISIVSQSIQSLTFENISCDFKDLSHLFECTPNLQRISINLTYGFPNQQLQTAIFSISSLRIVYHGYIESLTNLFENLPNLIHLTLETFDIYCDGYEWERILLTHLSNLQQFRLKMNLNFPDYHHINQQANELIETFRSSFWIDEHRWFVRCDWDPTNIFRNGILYTLPYAFDDCFYFDAMCSISTCSTTTDYWSYDCVQILSHGNPENDSGKELILFAARFKKIRQLKISFPFHENFLACISSLNQLKSIDVTLLHTDSAYLQLQDLLHRALHLYSLKLSYSTNLPLRFFGMTSPSIRRLDFLDNSQSNIRYFDTNECLILIHSPLILQCEVLSIGVKDRLNILHLINAMPHLRSFICWCKEDTHEDEFIEWLCDRFPSTYSIHRDEKRANLIRFWIE